MATIREDINIKLDKTTFGESDFENDTVLMGASEWFISLFNNNNNRKHASGNFVFIKNMSFAAGFCGGL